jgi:hypothetical protein
VGESRRSGEFGVLLDQGAGLVAVQTRHHDVAKNQVGLVVGDLGQGVEAVLGEQHLAARLGQKYLSATPDGVGIVDDHHLDAVQGMGVRHVFLLSRGACSFI